MSLDTRMRAAAEEINAALAEIATPAPAKLHHRRRNRVVVRVVGVVVVLALAAGVIVQRTDRRTEVTTTRRPQRIVAVDRFGSIFELDGTGRRVRELLPGPARAHTDPTTAKAITVARLYDGRVAYGVCCISGRITVEIVGDPRPLAAGILLWSVSPNGRTLATARAGSPTITLVDLPTGARHTIDLTKLSRQPVPGLAWATDSRHLLLPYSSGASDTGFIYRVDTNTGAVKGKVPVADVSNIAELAALADGRILALEWKSSAIPPATDAVYAIEPGGTRTLVARFSPGAAQLHIDASGTHVLVVADRGLHWLEPDGSTGLIAPTPTTDDYWSAAW